MNQVLAYGRDTINPTNDTLASLAQAKANASVLQQLFSSLNYDACMGATLHTGEERLRAHQNISWFPNPIKSGKTLTLRGEINILEVQLFSMLGTATTCVFSSNATATRLQKEAVSLGYLIFGFHELTL